MNHHGGEEGWRRRRRRAVVIFLHLLQERTCSFAFLSPGYWSLCRTVNWWVLKKYLNISVVSPLKHVDLIHFTVNFEMWDERVCIDLLSLCLCLSAFLVQEERYFMDTVELKGLKYDPVLQDENSGFSIVLSSVLKSKVGTECHTNERPVFCFNRAILCRHVLGQKCLRRFINITSLCWLFCCCLWVSTHSWNIYTKWRSLEKKRSFFVFPVT